MRTPLADGWGVPGYDCQPNRVRFGWAGPRALVSELANPVHVHVTTPQSSTDLHRHGHGHLKQGRHPTTMSALRDSYPDENPIRMILKRRGTAQGVRRMEFSRKIVPSHGR
jgi:hypothetical protein